nr:uncharacterized protein LOC109765997 [Aegilops tauschii subsp. strangulata]
MSCRRKNYTHALLELHMHEQLRIAALMPPVTTNAEEKAHPIPTPTSCTKPTCPLPRSKPPPTLHLLQRRRRSTTTGRRRTAQPSQPSTGAAAGSPPQAAAALPCPASIFCHGALNPSLPRPPSTYAAALARPPSAYTAARQLPHPFVRSGGPHPFLCLPVSHAAHHDPRRRQIRAPHSHGDAATASRRIQQLDPHHQHACCSQVAGELPPPRRGQAPWSGPLFRAGHVIGDRSGATKRKGLVGSLVALAVQLRDDNFAVLLQSSGYALQSARMGHARKIGKGDISPTYL